MSMPQSSFKAPRLLIVSDLHLERGPFNAPNPDSFDIAVLAGDILPGPKAVHWARRESTFGGKPVAFVPGNHEFYGGERTRTLELLREHAAGTNVHVLDRDEVTIAGVRFLGATMWTDFALDAARGVTVAHAMHAAKHGLNDFVGAIRERVLHPPALRNFMPQDAAREHASSRAWLRERLAAPVDASHFLATVVITHHAPSARSMHEQYAGSALNPCFYSRLPEAFFQTAALWIHGHSHSSADYMHHRTRVVANPRGYLSWTGEAENQAFKSDLVIEITPGESHD
jgi:predicted phosphodiesterase